MALAGSVVLAAITAAVVMLAERLRGDRASGAAGGEF
jgi:thiamine transport system permease protein